MSRALTLIALVVPVMQLACADSAECSDGETLDNDTCIRPMAEPTSPDAGAGDGGNATDAATADSGTDGSDADAATANGDNWGTPCTDATDHSDCTGEADYCAVMPGATEGICTRSGCAEDATVCPPEWGCLDLSLFGAGLPSICTEP